MFDMLVKLIAIIGISMLPGCSDLSSDQKIEVEEALRALGEIDASTTIGINYRDYNSLVLKSNAQVKEAADILPEGQLRDELISAMSAYVDARAAWAYHLSSEYHTYLSNEEELGRQLIAEYSLPETFETKDAVPIIWEYAGKHYMKAKGLYESF